MPELPEVETVVRNINSMNVIGKKIEELIQYCPKLFEPCLSQEELNLIQESTLIGCRRRGKYIVFILSGNKYLLLHLRMSGKVYSAARTQEVTKHTRGIITFENCELTLHFVDPRKFGRMTYVLDLDKYFQKLGPEPLEKDFTSSVLCKLLSKKHTKIKALLLDQHVIAGIGNIYADEALFLAKIHPNRMASSLHSEEIIALHTSIQKVLQTSIIRGGSTIGTSISNFHNAYQKSGTNQVGFAVYKRASEKCLNCCTIIQKIKIASRSTHFCPSCQKEKE